MQIGVLGQAEEEDEGVEALQGPGPRGPDFIPCRWTRETASGNGPHEAQRTCFLRAAMILAPYLFLHSEQRYAPQRLQ